MKKGAIYLIYTMGGTGVVGGGVLGGGYDGAEVCRLVGTFLLKKISEICNKRNIVLHRGWKTSMSYVENFHN